MPVPRPPLPTSLAILDERLREHGPRDAVRTLGRHVKTFPESAALTAGQRAQLDQVPGVVRRIRQEHNPGDELLVLEMMTLDELGRFNEAGKEKGGKEKGQGERGHPPFPPS